MKQIPLTKGQFAIVDDEDYERLMAMGKWKVSKLGYAEKCKWINEGGKKRCIMLRMHRIVMNCPDDKFVDHKFGNTLDNRKSHLRICTKQQNNMNCAARKNNTSGFKGVEVTGNKWKASIRFNRKRIALGVFLSALDAARAYNAAAINYFGEFANLNEIPV